MAEGSFWTGRAPGYIPEPSKYNPQQQDAFRQALTQGQQGLGTDAIEGNARRNFNANILPLLRQRFGGNSAGYSGVENELINQGSLLESRLAANRQSQAMDLLKLGLQPEQDYRYDPGSEGALPGLLQKGVEVGGDVLSAYLSGGATAPGSILKYLQQLFGNRDGGSDQGSQPSSYFDNDQNQRNQFNRNPGQYVQQNNLQKLGLDPNQQYSQFNNSLRSNVRNDVNSGSFAGQQRLLGQSIMGGLKRLGSSGNNVSLDQFLGRNFPNFSL